MGLVRPTQLTAPISCVCSLKQQELLIFTPKDGMLDHYNVLPPPQHITATDTWRDGNKMK